MTLKLAHTVLLPYQKAIAEDGSVQVGALLKDRRIMLLVDSLIWTNFIDITCEDCFPEVLKIKKSNHPSSGSTTSLSDSSPSLTPIETSDSILEEFADELALY
ncbi:hypothetical protein Tco_0405377 [Tanacetum coccineum]